MVFVRRFMHQKLPEYPATSFKRFKIGMERSMVVNLHLDRGRHVSSYVNLRIRNKTVVSDDDPQIHNYVSARRRIGAFVTVK